MLLLLCRRANHQHGHVSKHLIHRRASGEVAYRLRKALEHRPVGIGMAEDLDQLDSDISCMEVGEDEDICLTCHFAGMMAESN